MIPCAGFATVSLLFGFESARWPADSAFFGSVAPAEAGAMAAPVVAGDPCVGCAAAGISWLAAGAVASAEFFPC